MNIVKVLFLVFTLISNVAFAAEFSAQVKKAKALYKVYVTKNTML